MQHEHDDALRSAIRRARIVKVDDSGDQQLVDLKGLKNEELRKIYRPMDFGFFSIPPKDTEGVITQMGGRSDRTVYQDGGHKDYRPKNRPAGSAGLFDQYGNLLQSDKDKHAVTHNAKLIFQLGKGYDAKDAQDYNGDEGSLVIENGKSATLTFAGSTVTIDKGGKIIAQAKSQFAGGVAGGRWVVARSGRVDLGVKSPDGQATNKVMTEAGASNIVYAEIA